MVRSHTNVITFTFTLQADRMMAEQAALSCGPARTLLLFTPSADNAKLLSARGRVRKP